MTAPAPARLVSLSAGTVLGFPPGEVVDAAAAAGFGAVGLRWKQPGMPAASAPRVRRQVEAAGLTVLDVEVVRLRPGVPVASFAPLVDVAAELGARFLLAVSHHPEPDRTADELAALADRCGGTGVRVALEAMRFTAVPTFRAAAALLRGLARPDVVICLDPLHLQRGGETPEVLREDGARIGYVQLCDAPLRHPGDAGDLDALAEEARHHRLHPGEGELPLVEMLAAVPATMPCTVEVQDDREAGVDARRRARRAMDATRRVLDRAAGITPRTS